MEKAFKIRGVVKNYEWGKLGLTSTVAQLFKSSFKDFVVKDDVSYAELWIGTHSSGPAQIPHLEDLELMSWIKSNPECLGKNITSYFTSSNGLPFLFKVLSVNKALSIQVHPDKCTAEKLHKDFPQLYPDGNHKPEIAIALTDFEALCGFRPLHEIKEFFTVIPQLHELVGEDVFKKISSSQSECDLKILFTTLMTCPTDIFQEQLKLLIKMFEEDTIQDDLCKSIGELFLRITAQYPNDIGCLCLFFLNYLKLKPGEAIFLAANEPHAYLLGDCIECMACSDNVVRAGLTPKFKDVETLCNILTYNCKTGEKNIFTSTKDSIDPYIKIYTPPVREFAIDMILLPISCKIYSLRSISSASVLLVVQGFGKYKYDETEEDLCPGSSIFVSSDIIIHINPKCEMLFFRSYCNA